MPDGENAEAVEVTTDVVMPDVSAYEAKISELTASLAERDASLSGLTADLTASKAANYDLLISGPRVPETQVIQNDDNFADTDIDIDDLFD